LPKTLISWRWPTPAFEPIGAIHHAAYRAELVEYENRCQDLLKAASRPQAPRFGNAHILVCAVSVPGEPAVIATRTTVQHNRGTVVTNADWPWKHAFMVPSGVAAQAALSSPYGNANGPTFDVG